MGKNRDRESLIRMVANLVVHEIVFKGINRVESKKFLKSEIIEYGGRTEKKIQQHSWNDKDLEYIKGKAIKKIKDKLNSKYSDIFYSEKEINNFLDKEINDSI